MPRSEDLRLDNARPSAVRGFVHEGKIECLGTQPPDDGVSVTVAPGGGQFILRGSDYIVVAAGSNASMVLREISQGNFATLKLKHFVTGRSKAVSKRSKNPKRKKAKR